MNAYTLPAFATLPTPSSTITTNTGTTANVVASQDGFFTVSMTPGTEFPKYGGMMEIEIPYWYSGGTDPVFNLNPKTVCSTSSMTIENQLTSG